MKYFLVPRLSHSLRGELSCSFDAQRGEVAISHSLSYYLSHIKDEIDEYKREWEVFKLYTNPFEFIHTPVVKDKMETAVGKFRPLSRSFYKMIELLAFFRFPCVVERKWPIRSFHLAEGPGGFIEALSYARKGMVDDEYVGMTLVSGGDDGNIPKWKKSKTFLKLNPNVKIEFGADQTGNLLSLANFEHCYANYQSSMDVVTGDGGFDFSEDFNNQEDNIAPLLFAQTAFALVCQKTGGVFILKLFDMFMSSTIDLVAYLSSFYENVFITKPNTSRYVNSEKYLVCTGFLCCAREIRERIFPLLRAELARVLSECASPPSPPSARPRLHICRLLNARVSLPHFFLNKLRETNSVIGQQQIERIYFTLVLIKNDGRKKNSDKIDALVERNKAKCIEWCVFHKIPVSSYHTTTTAATVQQQQHQHRHTYHRHHNQMQQQHQSHYYLGGPAQKKFVGYSIF